MAAEKKKKKDWNFEPRSWWPFITSVAMAYLWGFVYWSFHSYNVDRFLAMRRTHPLSLVQAGPELADILWLSTGMLIAAIICFHLPSCFFFPKRKHAPHVACILSLFTYAMFYIKLW